MGKSMKEILDQQALPKDEIDRIYEIAENKKTDYNYIRLYNYGVIRGKQQERHKRCRNAVLKS